MRALIAVRPATPRWPNMLPTLLALGFAGHAFEDGGAFESAILLAMAAVGVLQMFKPTVLGWAVLLTPFILWAMFLVGSGSQIPRSDWGPLAVLTLLPIGGLLIGHPWSRGRLTAARAADGR